VSPRRRGADPLPACGADARPTARRRDRSQAAAPAARRGCGRGGRPGRGSSGPPSAGPPGPGRRVRRLWPRPAVRAAPRAARAAIAVRAGAGVWVPDPGPSRAGAIAAHGPTPAACGRPRGPSAGGVPRRPAGMATRRRPGRYTAPPASALPQLVPERRAPSPAASCRSPRRRPVGPSRPCPPLPPGSPPRAARAHRDGRPRRWSPKLPSQQYGAALAHPEGCRVRRRVAEIRHRGHQDKAHHPTRRARRAATIIPTEPSATTEAHMAATAPPTLDQQVGLALGAQAESPCSLVDEARPLPAEGSVMEEKRTITPRLRRERRPWAHGTRREPVAGPASTPLRYLDLEAAFDWLLDHGQAGDAWVRSLAEVPTT
jgi:hypothetical protein